jgi:hypothetical protein
VQRAEQFAAVASMEAALVSLHKEEYPQAQRPVFPPPAPADLDTIQQRLIKEALNGIGLFKVSARKAAKASALEQAHQEAAAEDAKRKAEHAQSQKAADAAWASLCAHDPDAVLVALEAAFEDNESPAACVDAGQDDAVHYVTVVVTFGTIAMIPEQKPATTPTGNPTLKKRTKGERNALYAAALGSTVLATVKEAFAVSPSTDEVRVVVVRKDPTAATPAEYLSAIYAARFPRDKTMRLDWQRLDPAETLLRAPDALLRRRGAAQDVVAIDVDSEPQLSALVDRLRPEL